MNTKKMLKLAAQPNLMFTENIKTFGWCKKIYVTVFGRKIITVEKVLDGNTRIDTVFIMKFRQMKNGDLYVMSGKYEQIKL